MVAVRFTGHTQKLSTASGPKTRPAMAVLMTSKGTKEKIE
jgi:hypothetical protein